MIIGGFEKLTLLDYKGKVAGIIFTGGCNFRCPYCHNGDIVTNIYNNEFDIEEITSYLKKRKNILDGVVISGGEPLIHSDIEELIAPIKELGYSVKLDTNGTYPERLKALIEKKYLDYIAMDIKGPVNKYALITGITANHIEVKNLSGKIHNSIELIMGSGIDYEFRTTYVKGLHTTEDFENTGRLIKGADNYYIQNFRQCENVLDKSNTFESFSNEELFTIKSIIEKYVKNVYIR